MPNIPISKPNLVDQDNPTNPQANVFGGGGPKGIQAQRTKPIQGPGSEPRLSVVKTMKTIKKIPDLAKPNLATRMNKIIGGK